MNADYEEFKIILNDGIARRQLLELAGLSLTDVEAAHLLANEGQCLMFYSKVTGLLQARVMAVQQAQVQATMSSIQAKALGSAVLVFLVIAVIGYFWWKSLGL